MSCCQAAQTFPSGCACETSDAVSIMRSEIARIPLRSMSLTWYSRSRGATPLRVTVPSVKRIAAKDFCVEINLYQLFGVGALAHRGLLTRSGVSAGNRNMPDHGLRPKASRQQEPWLPSQALTQGCISLLPYQLDNVKLHYLVVRNEALHSGEGVPRRRLHRREDHWFIQVTSWT